MMNTPKTAGAQINRAILIGFGHHGRNRLFKSLLKLKQIETILVYDIRPEAVQDLTSFEHDKQVKSTSDFNFLLSSASEETFVVIGTTAKDHLKIFREVVEKGVKYIYIEKPLAQSISDCKEMVTLAQKNGVNVAVGFYNDFIPLIYHHKRLELEYGLGRLLKVSSEGGAVCLSTNGVHVINLANLLFGDQPVEVYGRITSRIKNPRGNEYFTHGGLLHALYKGGQELLINYNNASLISHSITLYYEYGFIRASYDDEFLHVFGYNEDFSDRPKYRYQKPLELQQVSNSFDFDSSFDTIFYNLLNCGVYCTLERAFMDMQLLLGAFVSDTKKRSITLPIEVEDDKYHERFPIT
jgi:predicted dehydrogenase